MVSEPFQVGEGKSLSFSRMIKVAVLLSATGAFSESDPGTPPVTTNA